MNLVMGIIISKVDYVSRIQWFVSYEPCTMRGHVISGIGIQEAISESCLHSRTLSNHKQLTVSARDVAMFLGLL